jgi:hypothetical protein
MTIDPRLGLLFASLAVTFGYVIWYRGRTHYSSR